jgi:hypothetical protein
MMKRVLYRHIKADANHRNGHKLVGICLALIGFFWFAKNVGWIPVAAGGSAIFWPAVLFIFGVFIIVGKSNRRKKHAE